MSNQPTVQFIEDSSEISFTEVFELLDLTVKNLKRIERLAMQESGLTPSQYHVLNLLWEGGEMPLKDLAQASSCTRATMTGLIDVLERKGFVRRVPNPEDRRSLLASLTEGGKALQEMTPSLRRIYSHCCVGLSPEEFQQLGQLLGKLNNSFVFEYENIR
jgi:MarR family 2-MHQ and catechol resistance regulon transcriptional repressor